MHLSIGWLFLINAEIHQISYDILLFSAVVFLPLYIDANNNDVGGDAHYVMANAHSYFRASDR
jgi:exo-beta-1,3-glucanase (GH17 family)